MIAINEGLEGFRIIKEDVINFVIRRRYELDVFNLKYVVKEVRYIEKAPKQFVINIRWRGDCTTNSYSFQLN